MKVFRQVLTIGLLLCVESFDVESEDESRGVGGQVKSSRTNPRGVLRELAGRATGNNPNVGDINYDDLVEAKFRNAREDYVDNALPGIRDIHSLHYRAKLEADRPTEETEREEAKYLGYRQQVRVATVRDNNADRKRSSTESLTDMTSKTKKIRCAK